MILRAAQFFYGGEWDFRCELIPGPDLCWTRSQACGKDTDDRAGVAVEGLVAEPPFLCSTVGCEPALQVGHFRDSPGSVWCQSYFRAFGSILQDNRK